jgi:hypothetical protein
MSGDRIDGAGRGGHGRRRASPAGRAAARGDELRAQRDRTRIAQTAARLIVEHGITDWTLAKRKAARQLMLAEDAALPSNDDIERALTDHHALFGGVSHAATLRRQRQEALAWMRRLEKWQPVLVGGVAAGWATEHSDVRLELVADDPKAVELALAGAGVAYATASATESAERAQAITQLRVTSAGTAVRIAIFTPAQRRSRPRNHDEPRLSADALSALLSAE